MKTEISKLIQMKHFFTILQLQDNSAKLKLMKPSRLLINNIHANWLKYTHAKSNKHNMPVYLYDYTYKSIHIPAVFGAIKEHIQDYDESKPLEIDLTSYSPKRKSELTFDLTVPQQNAIQYFIQWQRYRKYWWSSISTTPSLFAVNGIRYEDNTAHVDIVAQLPGGQQPVESISFKSDDKCCRLTCLMCLEDALFILLLDGLTNYSKEEYLRLHRKIAPYKISIALDLKDKVSNHTTMNKVILRKLATLQHQRLQFKNISAWLPDFSLPLDSQIKESLHVGVNYTAILDEETLKSGIFRLMNSSTKLMELVHVADFHKYASLLFGNN